MVPAKPSSENEYSKEVRLPLSPDFLPFARQECALRTSTGMRCRRDCEHKRCPAPHDARDSTARPRSVVRADLVRDVPNVLIERLRDRFSASRQAFMIDRVDGIS